MLTLILHQVLFQKIHHILTRVKSILMIKMKDWFARCAVRNAELQVVYKCTREMHMKMYLPV